MTVLWKWSLKIYFTFLSVTDLSRTSQGTEVSQAQGFKIGKNLLGYQLLPSAGRDLLLTA